VRLLVAALLLACVVLLLLVLLKIASGGQSPSSRELASARWSAAHVGAGGSTHVEVRLVGRRGRVLESRQVATIPDLDPDYDARLLEALAQARSRAGVLNLELGAGND
jgi:hypothetical protein